ncbi:MAG: hypothetical protein WAO35_20895 [Terriglobia bacterium]
MKSEKPRSSFVLCIRNDGAEDLEPRKVYQLLPDRTAAEEGYTRVIDESGEDYLYPADYFVPLRLPAGISRELASLSASARQPGRRAALRG